MKELLEDILDTLNTLPNRKVTGRNFTTYDLAKRVEEELEWSKKAGGLDFAFRWFGNKLTIKQVEDETNTQTD
jgi:hypothetical protein